MMIGGLLLDASSGRHHPIFFRPAPMPGGSTIAPGVQRYKSCAHHTEGFATRSEAASQGLLTCRSQGWEWRDQEWLWDGGGIPAIVAFIGPLASPSSGVEP